MKQFGETVRETATAAKHWAEARMGLGDSSREREKATGDGGAHDVKP